MHDLQTILFDFDGTLADTRNIVLDIFNSLATDYGLKPIQTEEKILLQHMHAREVLTYLGISNYRLMQIGQQISQRLKMEMIHIQPILNMKTIVQQLNAEGYCLGIISSNTKENIHIFLNNNQMTCFNFVYCSHLLFGKQHLIKKVLKKQKLNVNQVAYIGDEVRDIEVAQNNGIKAIAVSWGYNDRQTLAAYHPDFLIDKPEELLTLIQHGYY